MRFPVPKWDISLNDTSPPFAARPRKKCSLPAIEPARPPHLTANRKQFRKGAAAMNAYDVLIEVLVDWRVVVIFGLPGDGINGIMEAMRTHEDKIKFVQVRHEESAAFMACGYAKTTGKLGVCLATSGPGGIHLLNGLYDAKMDGAPVLAITGL